MEVTSVLVTRNLQEMAEKMALVVQIRTNAQLLQSDALVENV